MRSEQLSEVYNFFFCFCRAAHNPDSRNALKGDGGVFDGAQDAVMVAGKLQFKPESEQEAAGL